MLPARSLAEAHLWMRLHDAEPMDHEAEGEVHTFLCAVGTGDREERFTFRIPAEPGPGVLGGPGPSEILSADELETYAARVADNVPPSPAGLVRDVVVAGARELVVAAAALEDAAVLEPGRAGDLAPRVQALQERFAEWRAAAPQSPPSRPVAAYLGDSPARLDPADRERVIGALPAPMESLLDGTLGPWMFVGLTPRGWLFRHPGGAVLLAEGDTEEVRSGEVVEGEEAMALFVSHAMELPPRRRLRVRAAMLPGRPAEEALGEAFPSPDAVRPLARVPGEGESVLLLRAETRGVFRVVVLALRVDDQGALRGHLVIQGHPAAEQLAILAEQDATRGDRAQAEAIVQARRIGEILQPVLQELRGTDGSAVRPRPGDYARVFTAHAAEVASRYQALWDQHPPRIDPDPEQTEIEVAVCPAGLLDRPGPLSDPFPRAYREAAPFLEPSLAWATWTYHRPGEPSGLRLDGLVWVDDHWAWFPKPWRVLRDLEA